MNKVSDKLAALVESGDPQTEVNLHVMLKRDLESDRAKDLARLLAKLATDKKNVKLFDLSGIVSLRSTLDSIKDIAENPNVVWIDQDTEAPMEELLDE